MAPADIDWDPETIRIDEIQALILRGYGALKASCYLALRIDNAAEARTWLREIAGELNSAAQPVVTSDRHLNIAFTHSGLQRLGLPARALAGFRSAFVDGAAAPPHRSRALGDVGDSAPENWKWGSGERCIDIALLLFTREAGQIDEFARWHLDRIGKGGLSLVQAFRACELKGRKEHFGFRDGISQPALRNANPEGQRPGVLDTRNEEPGNLVEPGEFLFGYRNHYGALARGPELEARLDPEDLLAPSVNSPALRDFARDGSFLVWRQLEEHVEEFWRSIRDNADDDRDARRLLAAKFFGRWPSGAPLALAPEIEDETLEDANRFAYMQDDPHGFCTPLGSHIRRGNPRDWLLSRDPEKARAIANTHRIIRRGRPYGRPLAESMEPEDILNTEPDFEPRGVHFLCFMADIERQFELIQGTWLNDAKFGGLYDELDPLLGATTAGQGGFTIQATPIRWRLGDLSRYVTVRGGAYLFMPSIRAVRFLGALPG